MVLLRKLKTIDNTSSLDLSELNISDKLEIPKLTTTQRDTLTASVGTLIWNTTTNEFQILDEAGTWEIVAISTGGSGFVTLANPLQTVTGDKDYTGTNRFTSNVHMGSVAQAPTSALHLFEANPTLQIESQVAGTSSIQMKGANKNIIDLGFGNNEIKTESGSQRIEIGPTANPFISFDYIQGTLAVGTGALNLPNAFINMEDATGTKYLNLPSVTNATEGSLPLSSDYYGGVYYQSDTAEIRTNINGVLYDIHHGGTTDITHVNTSDATSQLVGKDDTLTLTNKTVDKLQHQIGAAPAHSEGTTFYDQDEHTLVVYNDNSSVSHQLGQEGLIRVYNNSGVQIDNAKVVYVTGVEGVEFRPTIGLARADNITTSKVIGLTTSDIPDSSFGYVTYWGLLNDVDTSLYNSSDIIYLSEINAGEFTTTKVPLDGNYNVELGYIIRSDATNGRLLIEINSDLAQQAGEASRLTGLIRKGSPGTLTVGQLVYISGWNNGQGVMECEVADNSSASTMPAIGIVSTEAQNNITGTIVIFGRVEEQNTASYSAGDELYVGTSGSFTSTKPPLTALVQKVATVIRANVNGVLEMTGGDINDLPNIPLNNIWVGNGSGVPTPTLLNTVALTPSDTQTIINKSIDSDNNTITNISNADIKATAAIDASKIANGSVSNTEFQYLNSVTSSVVGVSDVQTLTNKTINSANFFDICFTSGSKELRVCANDPLGSPRITMISNFLGGSQQFFYHSINSTTGALQVLDSATASPFLECTQSGLFDLPKIGSEYRIASTSVLTNNTLGSGVVNSSLTSLGTLSAGVNIASGQAYKINNVDIVSATALSSSITSAPGLSLSASVLNESPLIIQNNLGNPILKLDRSSGTNTAELEMSSGDFRINVDGVHLLTLDGTGLNLQSSFDTISIGSTQVVKDRITGWSLPTGTASRATFNTATVTIAGLAEALKGLIDDLHISSGGHGLIG